jgi:hypothetical protein
MNEDFYIQLSFYSQPILIFFGTIGALFNQIIFRRRKFFRKASCSFYFRALSINDLFVLYFIVLTQWFNDQFHFDLRIKYIWYCKIRTYAMYCLYAISPYFLVLACFDRLCRTSKNIHLRKIATPAMARHLIPILVLFIMIIYGHILFQFNIIHSICRPLNMLYFQFLGYFLLIFYCLLPPILMSTFCCWTFFLLSRRRRKQQIRYRLRISSSYKYRRYRDYQLIKILFLYVTTNIMCTFPFAIAFLFNIYKFNANPQLSIWVKYAILLANFNYCSSFYVYTLGTPLYRRELLYLIKTFKRRYMIF